MKKLNDNFVKRETILRFCSLVLIVATLTGCYLPFSIRVPDSNIFDNVSDLVTKPVDIQFQLTLPDTEQKNISISMEILDDVTGLPYNSKIIDLKPISENVFTTILSVPSGSILKYRYVRSEQNKIPEATPDGQPIPYRMVYVSDNTIVTDVLQAWQGESVPGVAGILRGILLDQDTELPIPDMLVFAGGKITFTDANGKYLIEGLGQGIHNVVFYAIDGKYETYQQGALIEPGMTTLTEVKMVRMPEVNITFQVNQPSEGLGAPIYIAGNVFQLGNTFADLGGGMSIKPKRMPMLISTNDGMLSVTLQLFAGTDLRYKFTLGDGYWNAEQYQTGGFRTRQLIVPDEDATITHTIETWRSPGVAPITFSISIPRDSSPADEKYIQFQTDEWTSPIPLWPLGNGNFLYIMFSEMKLNQSVQYQFCRMDECLRARDIGSLSYQRQVEPSEKPQTITLTLDGWQNYTRFDKGSFVQEAYVPLKPTSYTTMIETTPEMNPSWMAHAPYGLSLLNESGVNSVVFSPKWSVSPFSPYLKPEIGLTPFYREISSLINDAKNNDFAVGLYPHLGPYSEMELWWQSKSHTETWWNEFFTSYRDFSINYAQIAQNSNIDTLILGGKNLLPAFEGGLLPDGSETNVPVGFDKNWLSLISDIQAIYSGKLLWATNVNLELDPLPDFIHLFDGVYISVDSPLALGDDPTYDMIQSGFNEIIDNHVYEVYRAHQKPITLAIAYPAVETAASGCALVSEACYNDGLFRPDELVPYEVNLGEQALIYNAILPIIVSRDWITGISVRGYEPTVVVHDGASSIAGKPAFDIIQYWFTNMKP